MNTTVSLTFLREQVCFTKVRESALTFNERLAELTLTYTERIAKTEGPQDENYAVDSSLQRVKKIQLPIWFEGITLFLILIFI